jgi:hypothetical protein
MSINPRTTLRIAAAVLATSLLVLPACSSDDEGGTGSSNADSGDSGDSGDPSGGDDSTDGGSEAAAAVNCEDLLTQADVEALFEEPAVLEDPDAMSNNAELGQTTCTWSTVEDMENTDDLSSQLVILQYYDGSAMSGTNFYDPELQYPDAEPLDLGDEAFIDTEGGIDIGFVEGDKAGFLTWTVIDMGGGEQDQLAKKDAVINLARFFHDQVA